MKGVSREWPIRRRVSKISCSLLSCGWMTGFRCVRLWDGKRGYSIVWLGLRGNPWLYDTWWIACLVVMRFLLCRGRSLRARSIWFSLRKIQLSSNMLLHLDKFSHSCASFWHSNASTANPVIYFFYSSSKICMLSECDSVSELGCKIIPHES